MIVGLLACGDDPSGGIETTRPVGDAVGTAASGFYTFESLTTACSGKCSVSVSGFRISVCDVGDRVDASALVTQTDGALRIDSDDSDYISRLEGGFFADGRFDVGGVRTQGGATFTVRMQVTGSLTGLEPPPGGTLAGIAQGHVSGSMEGESLSCFVTAEISGERSALEPPADD